jgi:hypothetical protein
MEGRFRTKSAHFSNLGGEKFVPKRSNRARTPDQGRPDPSPSTQRPWRSATTSEGADRKRSVQNLRFYSVCHERFT